jgi:hypothetical protein
MRLLNAGLKYADALFVVPVYQVCWVIMNCIVGMTYFQDFRSMTPLQIFAFVVGVLITLIGVRCLSQREMSSSPRANDTVIPPPATRQRRASTTTITPVPFHHSYDPLPPDAIGDGMLDNFAAGANEVLLKPMAAHHHVLTPFLMHMLHLLIFIFHQLHSTHSISLSPPSLLSFILVELLFICDQCSNVNE